MSDFEIYSALGKLLNATKKTVTIKIEDQILKTLKDNGFKLCFAKKVAEKEGDEGKYNVVWQSYDKYLETNTFSWTPQYQVFGINTFQENVEVTVSTGPVSIGLGEITTLDKEGRFGHSISGGKENSLNVENNYGDIHFGVSQISEGVDRKIIVTPIYVSQGISILGSSNFQPKESVLVWFEQNVETSTMFATTRGRLIAIDLTNSSQETRLYTDKEKWETV